MSHWQWDYALTPTPDHWIFNFILKKDLQGPSLGKRFALRETINYPTLPLIEIYRVYEDKYARFHYFSFSRKAVIDRLLDQGPALQIKYVKIKFNSKHPRCKIQEIGCGPHNTNKLIYCLPSTCIIKRAQA